MRTSRYGILFCVLMFAVAGAASAQPIPPILAAQTFAPDNEPATSPAASTTSAPAATQPVELVQPSLPSVPPGGIIRLTTEEYDAWQVTQTRPNESLYKDMLFLMLSKVAGLKPLSEVEFNDLEHPKYRSMLEDPGRYARVPVYGLRLSVRVVRVYKLEVGKGISGSPDWPKDRPIWKIDCLNAKTNLPIQHPFIVISAVDPTPFLPERKEEPDDNGVPCRIYKADPPYHTLPGLDLAGVFYKINWGLTREGQEQDYPVVLAWQLRKIAPIGDSPVVMRNYLIGAIVLIGFALFWYLRRWNKKSRLAGSPIRLRYRPLRDAPVEGQQKAPADAPSSRVPVDPELEEAVEEYRKEKKEQQANDDTQRKS